MTESFTSGSTGTTLRADSGAEATMSFRTRKWVRPEDLNANGTLFGGSLLRWIDEEAAVYSIIQLGNGRVVTKFMSEITFTASAGEGDIVEIGLLATRFGRTSLTMRAEARNLFTRATILSIEELVFVNLDEHGHPAPHGWSTITYNRDRLPVAVGPDSRPTVREAP